LGWLWQNARVPDDVLGLAIISEDWRYLYLNSTGAEHRRLRREDAVGRPVSEFFPDVEATPLFHIVRSCMTDRTRHEGEHLVTFPDGQQRWLEIRIVPVNEGLCVYTYEVNKRPLAMQVPNGDAVPRSDDGFMTRLRRWFAAHLRQSGHLTIAEPC
jgi:PAS domain-containing protein